MSEDSQKPGAPIYVPVLLICIGYRETKSEGSSRHVHQQGWAEFKEGEPLPNLIQDFVFFKKPLSPHARVGQVYSVEASYLLGTIFTVKSSPRTYVKTLSNEVTAAWDLESKSWETYHQLENRRKKDEKSADQLGNMTLSQARDYMRKTFGPNRRTMMAQILEYLI